jgi:hypothetical protein
MNKKVNKRGGARCGAGAPKLPENLKRVRIWVSFRNETIQKNGGASDMRKMITKIFEP